MNESDRIGDWMVENPVCAELWQPLSFIRQKMLESSFSFLPVRTTGADPTWRLISDVEVARYLRGAHGRDERERRMVESLENAEKSGGIQLREPVLCKPTDSVREVLKRCQGMPILVTREDSKDLLGIVTPFDLL